MVNHTAHTATTPSRNHRTNVPKAAPGTNRIAVRVGLGTTGTDFTKMARDRVPNIADLGLAIDGEIDLEEALQSAHLIPVADTTITEFLAARSRSPLLAADSLIGHTRFPHDSERGAGACRMVGLLKGVSVLDQLAQKVGRALRRRLDRLGTRERLMVDVHIVAASGGGFGSGLILLVALLMRDLIRRLFPQARCCIHVHLILQSNFDGIIVEQDIRNKVRANELGTLLELNAMQSPSNAARLYELLDCEEMTAATFDSIIPYHVSDERGRTATLREVLADRVLANIVAGTDTAVGNRLRAVASNSRAKTGALATPLTHPMVSVCQASVVAVPHQLAAAWAQRDVLKALKNSLSKPSPERLKAFHPTVSASLGLSAIENEASRLILDDERGILTPPEAFKRENAVAAYKKLDQVRGRFESEVRPASFSKRQQLVAHYEMVAIPKRVAELTDALVEHGATIHELVGLLRGAKEEVVERSEQARRKAEDAAKAATIAQSAYLGSMEKLATKSLFPTKAKDGAVGHLNALINAELRVERFRTLHGILRPLANALSGALDEARLVHGEAAKAYGRLQVQYKESRHLATYQSPTMSSVVKPQELDSALARIDDGINNASDGPPNLDIKNLIAGRHIGVAERIEAHVEALQKTFDAYFETNLGDVTGTVKVLNLDFSMRDWVEESLRDLACCSPVRMSATNVEPQTVIAAAGDDLAIVREVVRRNARLAVIDIVEGTDPRLLLLHRRIDGLTIEAIPTFADAKRAAAKFPKPGPGLTAWENLASSGHVLEAFEQRGLVPDEWLIADHDESLSNGA